MGKLAPVPACVDRFPASGPGNVTRPSPALARLVLRSPHRRHARRSVRPLRGAERARSTTTRAILRTPGRSRRRRRARLHVPMQVPRGCAVTARRGVRATRHLTICSICCTQVQCTQSTRTYYTLWVPGYSLAAGDTYRYPPVCYSCVPGTCINASSDLD